MPRPARTVAAAITQRLPDVGEKKLHKLLYFAQGHHIAAFGEPLFGEHLEAWEHGPVVGSLWKERKYGLPIEEPPGAVATPIGLGEGELNTVGWVLAHYGSMTGKDLEDLTHFQDPWRETWERRSESNRITTEQMATFFRTYADHSDDGDGEAFSANPESIRSWLAGARMRLREELSADDREAIRALIRR